MVSKSDHGWLESHLDPVLKLGDVCKKYHPDVYNDYGNHTALKLCALKYYIDVYTNILKPDLLRKIGCRGKAFIDVFAGAGLSKVTDDKKFVAGSMPIAMNFHWRKKNGTEEEPFDHYYGIEIKEKFHKALCERSLCFKTPDKFTIILGDADEKIDLIVKDIVKNKYHYLAFVDYEGLSGLSWASLKKLLGYNKGDVMVTVLRNMTREVGVVNSSNVSEERKRDTLERLVSLYSEDVINNSYDSLGNLNSDLLLNNYYELIKEYRENIVEMRIKGDTGYEYMLLYATKETSGGAPYVGAMETLKERLDRIDGNTVESVINVLRRGQSTLF